MLDRSSHFSSLHGSRVPARSGTSRNLPQIYIPAGKGSLPEIYLRETGARRLISSLKWFISTCIVGAAGLCIIGVAMYASTDINGGGGMLESLRRAGMDAMKPKTAGNLIEDRPARTGEKMDKIKINTKGTTTKHIIQDSVVERRSAREFIQVKPYARIVAVLSTTKPENTAGIPPFNPYDLYAEKDLGGGRAAEPKQASGTPLTEHVTVKLIDLAGGFMPEEDGQELSDVEVERNVAEADAFYAEYAAQMRPAILPGEGNGEGEIAPEDAEELGLGQAVASAEKKAPPMTTILEKLVEEDEATDDSFVSAAIAKPGETIASILKGVGAETWQAQAINDALIAGGLKLRPGQEVRMKLAGGEGGQKEPLKVSVFSGIKAEGTVERFLDGEYGLTDQAVEVTRLKGDDDEGQEERATLYTSIYAAAMAQDLSPDIIDKLMRILSYDVDFKQRVRPGDTFELFFDVKQDENGAEKAGELLFASMTIGGENTRYYRFRTPDGLVDFYNDRGSNSRKFLMQTPVKSGRFTSGFGFRRHPLLGIRKMHTGIDWAAPTGTPIMAAGDGTVEEAGRHGGNGNYIRIRHGNGYKTAYSHLSRFAPGLKKGMKVRQGQSIGFVGSTGFSTGPHLHYEVLINNRFTNPLKIRVPRSRQLNGRLLAEFKKEQSRVDELMNRAPVKTRIAALDE